MRILVAGGAGYIGGFVCDELLSKGFDVVILDDFSFGHRHTVEKLIKKHGEAHVTLVEGGVGDLNVLRQCWNEPIDAVIYLVGKIYTQEAEEDPLLYFQHNVGLFIQFMTFMVKATSTRVLMFSSSGTVYGEASNKPVDETHPSNPINPYSETKWYMERMCAYFEQAFGLRWIAFRYFNACGAALDASMGEEHPDERHLIPLLLEACKQHGSFAMYGTDYDTYDGTAIRDYIHVLDLATAHTKGLDYLLDGGECGIFNVGTGNGYSVKQVIEYAQELTGASLDVREEPRRPGDIPFSVAKAEKIEKYLHWTPEFSKLDTIIETAWRWTSR